MDAETPSDAAFTLWLATRDKRRVEAERNINMSKVERKFLLYATKQIPKVKKKPGPKPGEKKKVQQFTREQIEIALMVMDKKRAGNK